MNPSRALICTEPKFQKEIGALRKRIILQERRISETITGYASLRAGLETFHRKEYWPKVGIFEEKLESMREALLGGGEWTKRLDPWREIKRAGGPRDADQDTVEIPEKDELKQLYRKLIKLYHPDSASSDDDKAFCHARMAAINETFRERDIKRMRRYLKSSEAELGAPGQSSPSRLRALRMDENILSEILAHYAGRLNRLKESHPCKLMRNVRENAGRGIDVLSQLAADFKERINIYRNLLHIIDPIEVPPAEGMPCPPTMTTTSPAPV